jgi:hypothetical protein
MNVGMGALYLRKAHKNGIGEFSIAVALGRRVMG